MKELAYYKKIQVISNNISKSQTGRGRKVFTLESYKSISQRDILEMEKSAYNVVSYKKDCDSINVVKEAKKLFLEEIKTARDNHTTMSNLESKLQNYIVKFDIYKNHWVKKISQISNQEKQKKFKKLFDDTTHVAFDSSIGFALACCFRDYLIHGSNLIEYINTSMNAVHVLASRDKLLNDWEWNQTKTKLITSQPELIDLETVVVDSFEALSDIHEELINIRTADIIGDCKFLLMQYEKIHVPEKDYLCWFIMEKNNYEDEKSGEFNSHSLHIGKKLNMKMLELKWHDYKIILEYWKRIH